jgi:hypothetical protein
MPYFRGRSDASTLTGREAVLLVQEDGQPVAASSSQITELTRTASHPGMRVGTIYYFAATVLPSAATATVTINSLYAQPISVVGTVNRIGIEVTTGVAGGCRLGLYSNLNGLPGTLLVDAGIIDTTATAIVEATISDTILRGEWVWMVSVFSAAAVVRTGTVGSTMFAGSSTPSAGIKALTGGFTYGALPATAPTVSSASSVAPAMFLRSA